jgi:hypothetical protein
MLVPLLDGLRRARRNTRCRSTFPVIDRISVGGIPPGSGRKRNRTAQTLAGTGISGSESVPDEQDYEIHKRVQTLLQS